MFVDKVVKELSCKHLDRKHREALAEYLARSGRLFYKLDDGNFYVRQGDGKLHLAWYI